jgi:hypothetical protein
MRAVDLHPLMIVILRFTQVVVYQEFKDLWDKKPNSKKSHYNSVNLFLDTN